MPYSAIPRMNERKCRRTHKNSRDGCPNCKAKRIKCSEELPSCNNCNKKQYRCGYLDFPPEKLELLRQKNAKKSGKPIENRKREGKTGLKTSDKDSSDTLFENLKNKKATKYLEDPRSCNNCNKPQHLCGCPDGKKSGMSMEISKGLRPDDTKNSRRQVKTESIAFENDSSESLFQDFKHKKATYFSPGSQQIKVNSPSSNSNSDFSPYIGQTQNDPYGRFYTAESSDTADRKNDDFNSILKVEPKTESSDLVTDIRGDSYSRKHAEPIGTSNPSNNSKSFPLGGPSRHGPETQFSDLVPEISAQNITSYGHVNSNDPQAVNNLMNHSGHPRDIFALVSPITHDFIEPEFFSTRDDMRQALYKDSFFKLSQHENPDFRNAPTSTFENSYFVDVSFPNKNNEGEYDLDNSSNGSFQNAKINFDRHVRSTMGNFNSEIYISGNRVQNSQNFDNGQAKNHHFSTHSDYQHLQSSEHYLIDHSTGNSANGNVIEPDQDTGSLLPNFYHSNVINPYPLPNSQKIGKGLHNAISRQTSFPKITKTERLKNRFLSNFLENFTDNFKSLTNSEYSRLYSPVWRYINYYEFWRSVYNQSVLIEVYFSFFMDRSISVLLRKCNEILAVEDSREHKPKDSVANSPHLDSVWTSFTKKDLDILTKKSYVCYGALIRDLRESMTQIHIEFPIKISLFSSWSSTLNLHGSLETLSLLLHGTASLLNKNVHDAPSYNLITPTIKVAIQIIHGHVVNARVPDYRFDVIRELSNDFTNFKNFLIQNQDLMSSASEILLRDFLKLDSFLKRLINETYPAILRINDHYKSEHMINDSTNNIYFASPSMFFNILVDWLNIIPSEALTISSKMAPVKKLLYLFFVAVGKAILNVFTPIRSLFITEPFNIICTRVDFNCHLFKLKLEDFNSDRNQFEYLTKVSTKLLRMIKFFSNRAELLSHYCSTKSISRTEESSSYLDVVKTSRAADINHHDILRIKPKKDDLEEEMLTDFNKIITAQNYPILKSLHLSMEHTSGTRFNDLVLDEIASQHIRLKSQDLVASFDYDSGFFAADFDVRKPLEYYTAYCEANFSVENTDIEQVRSDMQSFEASRVEFNKVTKTG